MEAEVQLFGRLTHERFAAAWPPREGEVVDQINSAPKYVISNTLKDPEWQNATGISYDWLGRGKRLFPAALTAYAQAHGIQTGWPDGVRIQV